MVYASLPNGLLASLTPADLRLLKPILSERTLRVKTAVEEPDTAIEAVYFPLTCMLSVVAVGRRGRSIEVGLIGREGMSGLPILMGTDRSPRRTYVQIAGDALRISAKNLRSALSRSETLRGTTQHYVAGFLAQVSDTLFANSHDKLEERLARWLLMAQDRIGGDSLRLTHEFLSVMLGVRRPGVTDAIHMLEYRGLIRASRGDIAIVDRRGLEETAGDAYGTAEAELVRLLKRPR